MWGDVRETSVVSERFSSVRGLLLAGVIVGGLLLGGCGGSSEEDASVDTSEETTTEEVTQESTDSSKSEQASTPQAKNAAVSCAGFGSPGGAEQFFMTSATSDQKEALDPNGNGMPCDEEGNKANPQNKAPAGNPKSNPNVDPVIGLLNCQLREAEEDLGQAEAERLFTELFEEVLGAGTSVQAQFAERGYTCGGLAADVLGEGN